MNTMNRHYTLNVTIILVGPILTAGGFHSSPVIDSPMLRDRFGRWMLPFSLIKGKVLDAIQDFIGESGIKQDEVKKWFGSGSRDGSYDPERGLLRFSDFATEHQGNENQLIERIQIDTDTGAAKERMLQIIQAPFGYGEEVPFKGTIEFIAEEEESIRIAQILCGVMRWIPSYGANRTVGFGRVRNVEVSRLETSPRAAGTLAEGNRIYMELRFDRPLCMVGRRHSDNHFESLECISGTILKGAVAYMLQRMCGLSGRDVSEGNGQYMDLRRNFEKIQFSEARPRSDQAGIRPVTPPLSLVTCPVEGVEAPFYDVALAPGPTLLRGAAPTFAVDWKDGERGVIQRYFGWPDLPREQRTRTAVSAETGTASEGMLFSYGLVLPDNSSLGQSRKTFVWDASIGLEGIENVQNVKEELKELLSRGIVAMGKTRANAHVTWKPSLPTPAVSSSCIDDTISVVTLQTECLMTNPCLLIDSSGETLRTAYEDHWDKLSNGAIRLCRYFATQSRYGGFASQRAGSGTYEPFLLTDRGSVFVLDLLKPDIARKLLAQWQVQGLPNAEWISSRWSHAKPWQCCPYLRENGYGEIALDLSCHSSNRIPAAEHSGVTP
jgi:hypothetical protein